MEPWEGRTAEAAFDSDEALYQYVIYFNPSDYPNKYVLRQFQIEAGHVIAGAAMAIKDTIEEVRDFLPTGVVQLPVYPTDDKVISEVWM